MARSAKSDRFHAHRASGCDRDHCVVDRPAVARHSGGARGGPPHAMHEQLEADRPGHAQLRDGDRRPSHRRCAPRVPPTRCTWINGWSALARILPYSEQGNAVQRGELHVLEGGPENSTTIGQTLSVLICPSEIQPQVSSHDYGLCRRDQLRGQSRRLVRLGRVQRSAEPQRLRHEPEPADSPSSPTA